MISKASMLVIVTILMAIGSGCGNTAFVVKPLPLPERPMLTPLSADDVSCLSPDAYARLVTRDRERRQYAEELEVIIKSTHKE